MVYDNVMRLCEERGISLYKLEQDSGIGHALVQKWKSNSNPTLSSLEKIADVLGVSVSDLTRKE